MKKILFTVFAVIMMGALTACGQSGQIEETKEAVQEEGTEQITEEAAIDLESEPEETQVVLETEETGNDIEALEEDFGFPILDEIAKNVQVGTAGSFMTAVQAAVKLLDWGTTTGLDTEEIKGATVAWMMDKGNDEQVAFAAKMALVDEAYQKLLGEDAEELLTSAGCEDAAYPWSDSPVESIEAVMEAIGLR